MSRVSVTKILVVVFLSVLSFRFITYTIQSDFYVFSQIPCDPLSETCYIYECDPNTTNDCVTEYYKKVTVLASIAPQCIFENDCSYFVCNESQSCSVTTCSPESVVSGEICLSNSNERHDNT